jgi:hypothetical protein
MRAGDMRQGDSFVRNGEAIWTVEKVVREDRAQITVLVRWFNGEKSHKTFFINSEVAVMESEDG